MILLHFSPPLKISLQAKGKAPSKKTEYVALSRLTLINAIVFLITLCCVIAAKGQNEPLSGKSLFEKKCAKCHGTDGMKGRWGARNLQTSTLNNDELFTMIANGKGFMPAWRKKITPAQIRTIIEFIKTLRTLRK